MSESIKKSVLNSAIRAALLASSAIVLTACGSGASGDNGDFSFSLDNNPISDVVDATDETNDSNSNDSSSENADDSAEDTSSNSGSNSGGSSNNGANQDDSSSSNESEGEENNQQEEATEQDQSTKPENEENNEQESESNNESEESEEDTTEADDCNRFVLGNSYSAGEVVSHNGQSYRCLQAGWCSSSAAWAYEPGVGSYWDSAWELVGAGSCSADSIEDESAIDDTDETPTEPENTQDNDSSQDSENAENSQNGNVGALCSGFNVYPDFTQGTYAGTGDIMVYNNIAYEAKYYATSIPGSDDSWEHHLNCDGTQKGEAQRLSIQNRKDPVSLKVAGWPSHLDVATTSNAANPVIFADSINIDSLGSFNALVAHYEALINTAKTAGSSSIVLNAGILDGMIEDQGANLGTIEVKSALEQALLNTGTTAISGQAVDQLSDNAQGFAASHNLVISTLATNAAFGWALTLSGDFAYANHSGRESVWNAASKATASLLDNFGLYLGNSAADFVAFSKIDAANENRQFSNDEWYNALMYVQQVTDFVDAPALLWDLPTDSATVNYFFGSSTGERQLRHAAYSNVFAALFESNVNKIAEYQSAKIPLYYTGSDAESTPLTSISSLNAELASLEYTMNNEVLLYELPAGNQWAPSTLYKWDDLLTALNSMHNVGVAGDTFWLVDPSADAATNAKYAKVAIAAFLAQSMQETIRYDACDENNWAQAKYGAPTDYPMTASCGQLGQKYGDYGFNPDTGLDHPYSCPRNDKMELTAMTHAKWYGAPAPLFVAPDAVLEEKGLLVNDSVGRWDISGGHCNDVPDVIDESKQVYDREACKTYQGQKAGSFVWDGSSQGTVQGCGWWGRGVIQTTGRQNFGTLNHFIGRSHVNPDTIGQTIEGVTVEAAPEEPLFAELDLCSNPGLICSSEEHSELKWVAGLFFWVTAVQAYENEGGPYEGWNYYEELKAYVDGGLVGTEFVDAVSGIVNRGCPDDHCPVSGEVHAIEERRANFNLALQKMGLNPR